MRIWGIISSIVVSLSVAALIYFIAVQALPALSLTLFFDDTNPFDVIFHGAIVWGGLWTPIYGTSCLLLLTGFFAVPVGISIGIYTSEYAPDRIKSHAITLLESVSGIPSIVVGLVGFVLILILRHFFSANTCMLLAALCLGILVLPTLALAVFAALHGLPETLRITSASLGISKEVAIFKILMPAASTGIISGLLLAAGRCCEDTAVILMTGAVATSSSVGIFNKFEALPFFIYYTSANYQSTEQLSQVFVAALMLLAITFVLLIASRAVKR